MTAPKTPEEWADEYDDSNCPLMLNECFRQAMQQARDEALEEALLECSKLALKFRIRALMEKKK